MNHQYSDMPVTPWGGMQEMKILLDKTGIREYLSEQNLPVKKSNNAICSFDIIESFWVSIWIGCFRFQHTAVVKLDEVLRSTQILQLILIVLLIIAYNPYSKRVFEQKT